MGKSKNSMEVFGISYDLNILEIAAFRESKKLKNFELLETFIAEIAVVRDEILKYFESFDTGNFLEEYFKKRRGKNSKKNTKLYSRFKIFSNILRNIKEKSKYNRYGRDVNVKRR